MVYSDGSLAKEAAMLAENVYREDVNRRRGRFLLL